ncbi:N-acetylmuramoyl-L-alanine amidase, partial [bacterium]
MSNSRAMSPAVISPPANIRNTRRRVGSASALKTSSIRYLARHLNIRHWDLRRWALGPGRKFHNALTPNAFPPQRPLSQYPLPMSFIVCIDPGHPSEVGMGTRGKKLTEVGVVWDVAQRLKTRLEKDGKTVVLTKDAERKFTKNRDRAAAANRAKADLMVRLHCDAAAGTGYAVYWPSQQGTAQGRTGPALEVIAKTGPIAKRFHAALAKEMKGLLRDNGLKGDRSTYIGGKQGALTGSIFSEVPVVLIELCVLTNPKDEAFMAVAANREKVAATAIKASSFG